MVDSMWFRFCDDLYVHIGERYGSSEISKCVDELLPLSQSERLEHPLFPKYRLLMLGANYDRYRLEGGAVSCPWVVRSYAGLEQSFLETVTKTAIKNALGLIRKTETVSGKSFDLPDLKINHGIMPFPAVTNLMSLLKASGFEVVMVSGSHQLAVETLVRLSGLPVDRSFGMDPVIEDGLVTTELNEPVPWRLGKTAVIRKHYPQGHSIAFGDSQGDRDLLSCAKDAAVLIDHSKDSLLSIAQEAGWAVQSARPWIEQVQH